MLDTLLESPFGIVEGVAWGEAEYPIFKSPNGIARGVALFELSVCVSGTLRKGDE